MPVRAWTMLILVACGGKEPVDSATPDAVAARECDTAFSACGGDPQGTWDVAGLCDPQIDTSSFDCPEASYEITADRSTGSVVLAASGAYTRTYVLDADFRLTVPTSCLQGLGCEVLVPFSEGLLAGCSEDVEGCQCTGTFTDTDSVEGTWEVDGTDVVTDGGVRTAFCVTGDVADTRNDEGVRVIWTR